jgi:Fic family protein
MGFRRTGEFRPATVAGEAYSVFHPYPLPPEPPLVFEFSDFDLVEKANRALGELSALTPLLPDPELFVYFYVRKEAVLSSQIEGTQSSLTDLLLHENDEVPGVPIDDVEEVSCYVAAMQYGLRRLRNDGFPLSLRLLREIHAELLKSGRDENKSPGEFRRSQNWIGGTRPGNAAFVPPSPETVLDHLGALEKFLHDDPVRTPTLIKAALAHVQFETIHPFLDGNGRLGRLLITLLLCSEGALSEPTLYLSLFFKTHRREYYELLQKVRTDGIWEEWVRFFLEGVRETATQATGAARRALALFESDERRIHGLDTGRIPNFLRLHHYIRRNPVMTISKAATQLSLTFATVSKGVQALVSLGILEEITNKNRDRQYVYRAYLNLLDEGTEPFF